MPKRLWYYLILFLGVICVSFSAPLTRLTEAPPSIIAFYRLLITFSLLAPVSFIRKKEEFKKCTAYQMFLAFLAGIALSTHFIFWITSVHYTTVASSTVLVNTHPLLVVLFSYLLWREVPSHYSFIGLFLAIPGIVMLGSYDLNLGGREFAGDMLALAGAAAIAFYYLLGRILRQAMSLGVYTTLVYGTGSFLLALYSLFRGCSFFGYSSQDWLAFVALALFSTLLGHTSLNWSLKFFPASTVSISVLCEPAFASIMAWAFLFEPLSFKQITASLLALSGVAWFIFSQKKWPVYVKQSQ